MSLSDLRFTSPEKLLPNHDLSHFQCGEPTLDDWLRRRALGNEESGASRTYVICFEDRVVGYYALAVGAVTHADAPGRVRRNMPDPVPVTVIGRLAIDQSMQGIDWTSSPSRCRIAPDSGCGNCRHTGDPGARDLRQGEELL